MFASQRLAIVPTSFQYPEKFHANMRQPLSIIAGMTFFPKSLEESGFAASSARNFFRMLQLKI